MQWARLIKLMLLGAVGFWLPDTLLHVWRGNKFSGRDVVIATVLSPLMLLITFFACQGQGQSDPTKAGCSVATRWGLDVRWIFHAAWRKFFIWRLHES